MPVRGIYYTNPGNDMIHLLSVLGADARPAANATHLKSATRQNRVRCRRPVESLNARNADAAK